MRKQFWHHGGQQDVEPEVKIMIKSISSWIAGHPRYDMHTCPLVYPEFLDQLMECLAHEGNKHNHCILHSCVALPATT